MGDRPRMGAEIIGRVRRWLTGDLGEPRRCLASGQPLIPGDTIADGLVRCPACAGRVLVRRRGVAGPLVYAEHVRP